MSKLLKALALLLLVTTLVWGVTIWQWQRTPRVLDTYQVVFHLVLLPVALSVAGWLLYGWAGALMRHARRADARPASAATAAPAATGSSASTGEALRHGPHALWSSSAAAGPAADLAQLTAALAAGMRPGLDAELMDARGLPVFTGRCPDLDVDAIGDELRALRLAGMAEATGTGGSIVEADDRAAAPAPRFVRALALLERALPSALDALHPLTAPLQPAERRGGAPSRAAMSAPRFVVAGADAPAPGPRGGAASASATSSRAAPAPSAAATPAGADLGATQAAAASFAVCWLVPPDWSAAERQLARLWLGRRLAGALPGVATSEAIVVQPCAQAEQTLQQIDQRLLAWQREGRRGLLLALAAESLVGADWVDRLEQHGLLFAAERPEGRVPGEAAVALLLSTPDWPMPDGGDVPAPLRLHRPALIRRSQPADAGRASARELTAAIGEALAAAGLRAAGSGEDAPPDADRDDAAPPLLPWACTDLDTRPSRSSEAARSLLTTLPGLDPVAEVHALGQALGDVGLPRALLAVAVASQAVRAAAAPALVFTVHDPLERAALVLSPPAPPATGGLAMDAPAPPARAPAPASALPA